MVSFNKSALIAAIFAAIGSTTAQQFTNATGNATHFDNNHLPSDFASCGVPCVPPPGQFRIALASTLIPTPNSCCSTFTITHTDPVTGRNTTAQGTYAYTSSALARTTNLVLQNELFDIFADHNTVTSIPVFYKL